MRFAWLFLLPLLALPAKADTGIIADISARRIAVTTGFNGASTTLFGALPEAGDVIVVVEGPPSSIVVRRKARTLGLWVNQTEVQFAKVPGFYWLASSRPLKDMAPAAWLAEHHIGAEHQRYAIEYATNFKHIPEFLDALIGLRSTRGLFAINPAQVSVMGGRLYRADVDLPDDAPTGNYTVTTYLLQGGKLLEAQQTPLTLRKEGAMQSLSNIAQYHALLYAFLALGLALFSGWLSATLMRRS